MPPESDVAFICRARHFLESRDDFKQQKSALQELVEKSGHTFDLYPKYHCECNWIDINRIVFFNKRSICSILKSYGKRLLSKYQSLSTEERTLCGFCLNGILDLSNQKENGQRKIFTNSQWKYLNCHFKSNVNKHLIKLSDSTSLKLKEIIKELKGGNYEEAYYISLESVRPAQSMENNYLTSLPRQSIRVINGFPGAGGQFWLPCSILQLATII